VLCPHTKYDGKVPLKQLDVSGNIKMTLKVVVCEDVDMIDRAQDNVQ